MAEAGEDPGLPSVLSSPPGPLLSVSPGTQGAGSTTKKPPTGWAVAHSIRGPLLTGCPKPSILHPPAAHAGGSPTLPAG